MKVRRLRWQGSSRRLAVAERLRLELNAWLEGWSVDSALLTLKIVDASATRPAVGGRWLRANGKNGSLLIGARAAMFDGFGGMIARSAPEDTLGLGRRVGERALRALLAQFAGVSANQLELQETTSPASEELDPRFIGCELLIEGQGFDARLIVDSDLCEFWVPSKRPTLKPLLAREAALASEKVRLDVLLDLGQASLADTHGLQVGDVLVSSTPISSSFQLAHPDSRRLANARLFRQGSQRALQIDSVISPSKSP
jgi:hypothetical protein